jgi:hypothetical protein
LLDLHAVAEHLRQLGVEPGRHLNVAGQDVAAREVEDVPRDLVEVENLPIRLAAPGTSRVGAG